MSITSDLLSQMSLSEIDELEKALLDGIDLDDKQQYDKKHEVLEEEKK